MSEVDERLVEEDTWIRFPETSSTTRARALPEPDSEPKPDPSPSPKPEHRREYIQTVSKLPKPPSRETVLLVEDDPAVRGVAQRSLSRLGYRVLSAEGGESAMELARGYAGPIQLLLTDVMMPGKNGVEVAAAVQEVRPGIKVFFMSGYADQELIRQGLLFPRTHFLQKPFTPKELGVRVREILAAAPG